jgi:adenine-specific DNA-methyltransferase
MKERLDIAYKLLNANGVMFISIDDNEYANLKILCDAIAGENNVETLIWNTIAEGNSGNMKQVHRVRNVHEYIIILYKDKASTYFNKINEALTHITSLQTTNLAKNNANKRGDKERIFPITNSQNGLSWTDEWKYSKEEVERLQKEGLLHFGKDGKNKPRQILPTDDRRSVYLQTIVNKGSTTVGRKDLENVLGKGLFDNPKPLTLIKTLIRLHQNNNATVLDFFAGSGTTGHAVLELNQEDSGNRKFILCTNNENNICENITYQRIKTVITGSRSDGSKYSDGISANLKYFQAELVNRNDEQYEEKLLDASIPLIELENMICINNSLIYIAYDEDDLDEFERNFDDYRDAKIIYIAEDACLTATQTDLLEANSIVCRRIPRYLFN